MWIVYNREDSSDCGWEVETEAEAVRQCEEDDSLTYVWKIASLAIVVVHLIMIIIN